MNNLMFKKCIDNQCKCKAKPSIMFIYSPVDRKGWLPIFWFKDVFTCIVSYNEECRKINLNHQLSWYPRSYSENKKFMFKLPT